ncbi:acyl carrier protein [Ruminococcaceae bacterium YRB3002]|nr:acyl carrier protein [Ruminococcaceae bacterium YRB3002]
MDDPSGPRERNEQQVERQDDVMKKKDMIFDDIVRMLSQAMNISPTDITPDISLRNDLILDSLQLYELVIDLEEAYDIRLPDEILDDIDTIDNVVEMVYNLTEQDK